MSDSPPEGAVAEPLEGFIDPDTYTPRLITLLANAIIGRESYAMRQEFGLGTNEWRVVSGLARWPGSAASELSSMLFVNKAIISRSVRLLESHHLVVLESRQRRSRRIYLTSAGVEMFYRMRPISAHGQDLILAGMTPEQIDEVNSQLRRMLETLRGAELFFGSH